MFASGWRVTHPHASVFQRSRSDDSRHGLLFAARGHLAPTTSIESTKQRMPTLTLRTTANAPALQGENGFTASAECG
jgi:hypothetical protein